MSYRVTDGDPNCVTCKGTGRVVGTSAQLGLESTPQEYVEKMVAVFAEVRRVLKDDGTLWLNIGDSYAANRSYQVTDNKHIAVGNTKGSSVPDGLKPKDLVGIPWMLAFALRDAGWWLRCDIIWSKPNPMPESVTDRPTKAHEYLFLLSKSERYYYDADAIAEPMLRPEDGDGSIVFGGRNKSLTNTGNPAWDRMNGKAWVANRTTRNARSVWEIATQPYAQAHFAAFPEELARRCILAGARPTDTVLDPFGGSGTVAQVATGNGRSAIHIDLNPAYLLLAEDRIGPMLCEVGPLAERR